MTALWVTSLFLMLACANENTASKRSAARDLAQGSADANSSENGETQPPANNETATNEIDVSGTHDSTTASLTISVPELALASEYRYKVILTSSVLPKEQVYGPVNAGEDIAIKDLVPATYQIKLQKIDAADTVVSEGTAAVDAKAGETAKPTITLTPVTAKIDIEVKEDKAPSQQYCVGGPAGNATYTFKEMSQAAACMVAANAQPCGNDSKCGAQYAMQLFVCSCGPDGLAPDTEPSNCRRFTPMLPGAKAYLTQCKRP